MKKEKILVVFLVCFISITLGFWVAFFMPENEPALAANACASTQDGDWNSADTWTSCGGVVPQATDDVTISHAVSIPSGYTINAINDLTIASSTLTQTNSSTQTIAGLLVVQSGATLTHAANTDNDVDYTVNFVAGDISVNTGGTITANALGHPGKLNDTGYGAGAGAGVGLSDGGGGGHCGTGGTGLEDNSGTAAGGTPYCVLSGPTTMGSGGGARDSGDYTGGSGGGYIKLSTSGTVTIDGTISADGGTGQFESGGGGGGTVYISADIVTSTPVGLSAIGGNGANGGGGGGGGIIYIYTNTSTVTSTMLSVVAGADGTGATDGAFIWEKVNTDVAGSTCTTLGNGDWDRISWDCGRFPTSTDNVVIDHTVTLDIGFTIPSLNNLTINATKVLTQSNSSTQTISGDLAIFGTLDHAPNVDADIDYSVNFSANNITVSSTGLISADFVGHPGGSTQADPDRPNGYGTGPGIGSGTNDGSGGAHCGDGGTGTEGSLSGGTAYCDINNLITMGSGGGVRTSAYIGGAGGGLIILNATATATISGTITADGQLADGGDFFESGAGGGGSINITANIISGTPTSMTVTGGYADDGGGGGGGGGISLTYTVTTTIASSTTGVDFNGGAADSPNDSVVGLFLAAVGNTAPTLTALTPVQTSASAVTVTTTVADTDSDVTSLTMEYSLDNSTWLTASNTVSVTQSGGEGDGVVTSTPGTLSDIDTDNDGSVDLTIVWEVGLDVSDTDDTEIYFRLTPNDGTVDGSVATSVAFALDTKPPTAPGNLSVNSTSTDGIIFNFGSASVDNNFLEYKIFYATTSPISTSNSAITSSSEPNLGNISYNGSATTTLSPLSLDTQYFFRIWAFDSWGVDTSSAAEQAAFTLANPPGTTNLANISTSSLTIIADANGNPSNTTFTFKDTVSGFYTQNDTTLGAGIVWNILPDWGAVGPPTGLTPNTSYQFEAYARNGDGVITVAGAASPLVVTLADVPSTPTVDGAAVSTLDLTFGTEVNPTSTQYAIYESSTGNYVAADNGLDASSAVWQTTSTWNNPTITGLSSNTQYTFGLIARNSDEISTVTTTASAIYTLANAAGTPTIGTPTATTLPITIDVNSNSDATTYAVYNSTDSNYLDSSGASTSTAVYSTTSTLGSSFAATGLTANTSYQFTVVAKNGDAVLAATSTASTAAYTLANAAGTATIGTPTVTTLPITIDSNSNSSSTTYAVYNSTDSNYLDSAGASTSTAVYSTTSTLGSSFAATGLSVNTAYQFTVVARNGDSVDSATSTASVATYTAANTPSSVSATANSTTQITIAYSGDATSYYTENTTESTNSGWTTETSYSFTGLTCATSYSFRTKGKNGDDVDTSYASSVSVSTSDCPSTGGGMISVSKPSLPSVSVPVVVPEVKTVAPKLGSSSPVSVGGHSHTILVHSADTNKAKVTIKSDPITITLTKNEYEDLDTNTDTVDDLRVNYLGLLGGQPQFSMLNLTDPNELEKPVTINYGAYDSYSNKVILSFNVEDATQMAVSNYSDFRNTEFVPYTTDKMMWTLDINEGEKSVFVRFRTSEGGTADASDTIYLASVTGKAPVITTPTDQGSDTCSLTEKQSYKHSKSTSVYYITSDCTKRAFRRSDVFFTYFDSWNDVITTTKTKLDSMTDDTLGFMPYGPKYDPKYGALVKIVTDPKVYLLLGTEKYWITSETVFETLNYAWNWIEDVAIGLLDKYTVGSEITDITKHPNHTLIKYADSPKVYKLEEGKKRYITDEATFNSLKYRWDRIVTVDDSEVYDDGPDLGGDYETEDLTDDAYIFTSFLTLGSSGEEVKQLQLRLKELGFFPNDVEVNSYFGPTTEQAIKDFQADNDLDVFGYVGPGTRDILNK
ncbi:MAG: hypothetical protein HOA57_02800 [Candidatus Magasanikbacteria bacterium]|nr:hypothetical protein [Candidatus Magasanikbacteria bacterium]